MSNFDFTVLKNVLADWKLDIADEQINQFEKYYNLLIEWNQKINLTAITEFNEVLIKHFLDSLAIVNSYDISGINTIIDIGTGAGFPGIPLKIMFPDISITLLDSLQKRVNFLDLVIDELSLDNIKAIHGRAEDIARDDIYREQFDLCISRAVANLSSLTELCVPFVKADGYFVSYKSIKSDEEIDGCLNTFKELNCKVESIGKYELFDLDRSFIIIKRVGELNNKYPRRAGIPIKKPLG